MSSLFGVPEGAALRLVAVDWEVLPFVLEPQEALERDAPVIHPQIAEHNVLPPDPIGGPDVFLVKGDVEAGFAEADVVIEMDTSHHNPTQGALDPWCCTVSTGASSEPSARTGKAPTLPLP